jgi:tetratricopeptide (TPR) repeat protein
LARADIYSENGEFEKSISDRTEAIRLNPDEWIIYCRGLTYFENEDYDEAIADFTEAIRLNPQGDHFYECRGDAYKKKGELDKAVSDYIMSETAGNSEGDEYHNIPCKREIARITREIRKDPNNPQLYQRRAELFIEQKEWFYESYIIKDYSRVIELTGSPQAYNARGEYYLEHSSNIPAAISDFVKSLEIDKDFEQAAKNLHKAYRDYYRYTQHRHIKRKYFSGAKDEDIFLSMSDFFTDELLSKDISDTISIAVYSFLIDSKNLKETHYYQKRGDLYLKNGKYDKAIADYTEIIKKPVDTKGRFYPNPIYAFAGRSKAYMKKGKLDKAIADISEAIRWSLLERLMMYIAYEDRAFIYAKKGLYEKALADISYPLINAYNGAGAVMEKADGFTKRAEIYIKLNNYDKAIKDCNESIRIKPFYNARAYFNRGLAFFYQRKYARAIADFSNTILDDPGFTKAYYYRGESYRFRKEYEKAAADYSRCQKAEKLIDRIQGGTYGPK